MLWLKLNQTNKGRIPLISLSRRWYFHFIIIIINFIALIILLTTKKAFHIRFQNFEAFKFLVSIIYYYYCFILSFYLMIELVYLKAFSIFIYYFPLRYKCVGWNLGKSFLLNLRTMECKVPKIKMGANKYLLISNL